MNTIIAATLALTLFAGIAQADEVECSSQWVELGEDDYLEFYPEGARMFPEGDSYKKHNGVWYGSLNDGSPYRMEYRLECHKDGEEMPRLSH